MVGKRESGDDGTDTGDTHVDGGPCAEAGDAGTETDNAYVDGGPCVGAGAGVMVGLVASDWDDGGGKSEDQGQGGS